MKPKNEIVTNNYRCLSKFLQFSSIRLFFAIKPYEIVKFTINRTVEQLKLGGKHKKELNYFLIKMR